MESSKYPLSEAGLRQFEAGPEPESALAERPLSGFRLDRKDVELAWAVYAQTDHWINVRARDGMSVKRDLGPTLSISVNDLALRGYDVCEWPHSCSAAEIRTWRKGRAGNAAARAFPTVVAELFDKFGASYALFDIDVPQEIGFGTYYAGTRMGEFSWRRELEHYLWYDAQDERADHVRGLYWGQYLGPRLARKLDPDGSFLDHVVAETWPGTQLLQPIVKRFDSGAIFITLSQSPLHALERGTSSDLLAVVATALHRQFRKQGLYL